MSFVHTDWGLALVSAIYKSRIQYSIPLSASAAFIFFFIFWPVLALAKIGADRKKNNGTFEGLRRDSMDEIFAN